MTAVGQTKTSTVDQIRQQNPQKPPNADLLEWANTELWHFL